MTIKFNHLDYFHQLRGMANKDLSDAHNFQHLTAAKCSANLANIYPSTDGAYSTIKSLDTVNLVNGRLLGSKRWVSNLPNTKWAILQVKDQGTIAIVMVHFDESTAIELTPTVGMEGTMTGDITFNNTPAIRLFNRSDPVFYPIDKQVILGFISNHLGLCESLFKDIDLYTTQSNMHCQFDKTKLKLSIDVLVLLWNSCLDSIDQNISADDFWHKHKVTIAHAKKTLVGICQFINETSGSGIYEVGSTHHQRYKDALIYSSHMRNLYTALFEIYPKEN